MKPENIVTLTMNPAIDTSMSVKRMMAEHKMRGLEMRRDPGGGGINVARTLKRFGATSLAIFPMGGSSGHILEHLVADEGVRHQSFMIEQDCRENFTINELETNAQFRFVLTGPTMSEEEWSAGLGLMMAATANGGYAVASGSLPDGVPEDFYARLAKNLRVMGGARLVVDTSGPPLKCALDHGVYLVKPSLSEFCSLLNLNNPDRAACLAAARQLVEEGKTEIVALTMGGDGALLVSRDLQLYAKPPPVEVHGTVGAGDSFLGLMVLTLANRKSLSEAFRLAVAAGSAALMSPGTGLCTPEMVNELAGQVEITPL